jgi:tRNA (adenine22-N1)-methyltransferase
MKYDKLQKPKFSQRMRILVSYCLAEQEVWDLCCDHGFIGLYAHTLGKFKHIHFVDKQKHIIERLKALLAKAEVNTQHMSFHSGDAGHIDQFMEGSLILAGVGGSLGCKIIESLVIKNSLNAKRIIFSPHSQADISCQKLISLESFPYHLTHTDELEESGRLRKLFIFDRY